MGRRGVIGSSILALPVILITLVVLAVFILLVGTVLQLKSPGSSPAATFSLETQNARILGELLLQDSVVPNSGTFDFQAVETYLPSEYRDSFNLQKSLEMKEAISLTVDTYVRGRGQIPHDEMQALFTPTERAMADRYGCQGKNAIKVFGPQHSVSLGSSSGIMLMYDYPARQWSKGGEGLPKLESFSSTESILSFLDTYRSQGYYIYDLGSSVYFAVKGGVSC